MLDTIHVNTGLGAGGAGAATANNTSAERMTGKLHGFYIQYNDSPPATTDLVIEAVSGILPTRTLLTISNAASSGFFPVRQGAISPANAAITDSNVMLPLQEDKIKITMTGANDNDHIDVYAVVER